MIFRALPSLPVCTHLHSAFYTLSAAIGAENLGETVFRQTVLLTHLFHTEAAAIHPLIENPLHITHDPIPFPSLPRKCMCGFEF